MKINKAIIKKIEKEAKKYFKNASGCHDWSHVERVKLLALIIGQQEKANLGIIEVAALLHDIGRRDEILAQGSFCHAEKGAEIAKKILNNYDFNNADTENILNCIIAHRFRNSHQPETKEAKVLYDADKLDSIGAVGIGRAFLFAGHSGSGNMYTGNEKRLARAGKDLSYSKEDSAYLEYEIKLKKVKNKMLTKTGRTMAQNRTEFMDKFFKRFLKEINGKL